MIPSIELCPVPKRLSKRCLVSESFTATTGKRNLLFFSIDFNRITPVVVSSIDPRIGKSSLVVCKRFTRSAPSSIVISGFVSSTRFKCLKNSSFETPLIAWTSISFSAKYAATASFVDNGFEAQRATLAPPALRVSIKFAVSFVTCIQAPILSPSKGFFSENSNFISSKTCICLCAQLTSA